MRATLPTNELDEYKMRTEHTHTTTYGYMQRVCAWILHSTCLINSVAKKITIDVNIICLYDSYYIYFFESEVHAPACDNFLVFPRVLCEYFRRLAREYFFSTF